MTKGSSRKTQQGLLPFDRQPPTVHAPTSLQDLGGDFAHTLSATLHDHLAADISIALSCIESLSCSDFLATLAASTCLSVLHFDPPGVQGLLDLSPHAIFPIIDRLLGGRSFGPTAIPARPLTQIEQGLALQIIERAARALADSWSKTPAGAISVKEQDLVADPQQVRIMPAAEVVSVLRFGVTFAGCGGTISLCVPAPVTTLLVGLQQSPAPSPVNDVQPAQDPQALQKNIMQAAVELRALLAETKVRLSDVIEMQVGDIITTDARPNAEIPLRIEGQDVLYGRLGQFRGVRAIEITRTAPSKIAPPMSAPADPAADGGSAKS